MPLTDQDIRALVHLAIRCRPSGSPRWDDAGTFAAIAKVRHLALADVSLSVIRAADDAKAQTPGVIANLGAPNWQERGTRPQPLEPYDPTTACDICSLPVHRHTSLSGHEFVSAHDAARRRETTPKPPLPRRRDIDTPAAPEPTRHEKETRA